MYTLSRFANDFLPVSYNRLYALFFLFEPFFWDCEVDSMAINELYSRWKKTRQTPFSGASFLNKGELRPAEKDERCFVLRQESKIIAYMHCDPCYEEGVVVGYIVSQYFFDPIFKGTVFLGFVDLLIFYFKYNSSVTKISIGISPFDGLDFRLSGFSFFLLSRFSGLYLFYNFKEITQIKRRLPVTSYPRYSASSKKIPFLFFLSIYAYSTGIYRFFSRLS